MFKGWNAKFISEAVLSVTPVANPNLFVKGSASKPDVYGDLEEMSTLSVESRLIAARQAGEHKNDCDHATAGSCPPAY